MQVLLTGGDSDCSTLDRDVDVRDLLEAVPWGIAHGPLDTLALDLEADVVDDGGDWAADWAPHVVGSYIWNGGSELREMGYAFLYEAQCDVVEQAGFNLVKAPAPVDAMPDHWVESTGLRPYTVPELFLLGE